MSNHNDPREVLRRINRAWLDGKVEDLAPLLHPEIVMAFPGFSGSVAGRDQFLAGFKDFCEHAKIQDFREHDHQCDVAGRTAVLTFRYEMVYERSGERYRATGRDFWIFENHGDHWLAVWRTMLDIEEHTCSAAS